MKKIYTLAEVAEKTGVSVQSLYRRLDSLGVAGVGFLTAGGSIRLYTEADVKLISGVSLPRGRPKKISRQAN